MRTIIARCSGCNRSTSELRSGLEPDLIRRRVMMTEAGGDPLARSLKGAIGPDDWLEHVPRETRAYVSRILGPVARRRRKSRRG